MSVDTDLQIEPEEELGVEPADLQESPGIEPEPATGLTPAQERIVAEAVRDLDAVAPLVQVLPKDFPLPVLTRFVPNLALKTAAEQAASYALAVDVTGPEGLQRADLALAALRTSQKAIEDHFEEPASIANQLHKAITGVRGDWLKAGKAAIDTVGGRVWTEQRRLEALAAEERRKAQEQADREAREQAQREAEAARKNDAPKQVVEELQRRVETAVAPPVPEVAAPVMRSTSTVTTWKARPKGTPASAEPNPDMADLTLAQRERVLELMRAVLEKRVEITVFELNWKKLNDRAKADRGTFDLPGFEAFECGGVRAKGTRSR